MSLVLHNTLTRRKQAFEPQVPDRVSLYVCGPTVYDLAHVGNGRAAIVFDVLYRALKHRFAHVTYVRNVTDVDDKINTAAAENGEPIGALTARTERAYLEDIGALGVLDPDVSPRVTEHIAEIVAMIERLLASGHAYAAEHHVLFSVASFADYGRLSGRSVEEMIAGARIDVAPYKRDPADFVLWKPSGPELPGWDSPWGRGRPGWHIECSAMAERHLGETIDIHGGGNDLVFPHHENEVAQSTCAHGGKLFARFWLHNGMLTVGGEKMSKSLGNFVTIRDALAGTPGEAIRFYLLGAHYHQPLDWTPEGLQAARQTLDRFYLALRRVAGVAAADAPPSNAFVAALEDDLNTPAAIAELHAMLAQLNKADDRATQAAVKGQLLAAGRLLGVLQADPETWFAWTPPNAARIDPTYVDSQIAARNAARKARDFAAADRIRDALLAQGVLLEDGPQGTTWRRT
ncbi:MAG: cysteine--tRNA ligase, partial [Proteobacteria bacterium]|nr:cysteine--tRNA ligase [Pseudomonadota bacterium]